MKHPEQPRTPDAPIDPTQLPGWALGVIASTLDAIVTIDARGRVLYWNPAAERIFGYRSADAVGQVMAELIIPPEARKRHESGLSCLASGGEPRILDRRVRMTACDDLGRSLPVELTVTRSLDDPLLYTGFVRDRTPLRHAEQQLQAHDGVDRALRDWQSSERGFVDLVRRLAEALDYPMGSLWTRDEETGRLGCRLFWTAPGVDGGDFEVVTRRTTFEVGEGVPGRAWEMARPALLEDLSTALRSELRGAASAAGLRSGVAFPAVSDHGPLAVLAFYCFDRREHDDHLARTLTGIGDELGRFLDARRAELGVQPLTPREVEILRLAAEGNTGPEIAQLLVLSALTVKTHFANIYEKLGVTDRAAAVAYALRMGVIR